MPRSPNPFSLIPWISLPDYESPAAKSKSTTEGPRRTPAPHHQPCLGCAKTPPWARVRFGQKSCPLFPPGKSPALTDARGNVPERRLRVGSPPPMAGPRALLWLLVPIAALGELGAHFYFSSR